MQKQSTTKLSALSLSGFLSTVQKNIDADNARAIKRYMQKGIFEELWQRARKNNDVTMSTTYSTVGLLAAHTFNGGARKPSLALKKELFNKPLIGLIKSRVEFHDDIRYILTVVQGELCLLLDNAAIDSRMATVMTYDPVSCSFIANDDSLIDFVLENEVAM